VPPFELLSILDFVNCTDEARALGSYMELLTNSQTVLLADWQIERGIPIRTLKLNEQKAVVEFGNAGDRKDEAHHVSLWINRPTISPMEQDPGCPVLDTSFRYAGAALGDGAGLFVCLLLDKIVVRLEIHPKCCGGFEITPEPPRHVVTDTATLMDDDAESLHRNAQGPRQLRRAQAQGSHELFAQNLAWMDWLEFLRHHTPLRSYHFSEPAKMPAETGYRQSRESREGRRAAIMVV
jgi:hypothetical protein